MTAKTATTLPASRCLSPKRASASPRPTAHNSVSADDRESTFTLQLGEGWTKMQTWFYDDADREISGAYFVYVERN